MKSKYFKIALKFANDVIDGKIIANVEQIQACKRFIDDLKRTDEYDFRSEQFEFVIELIQKTIVHQQGEDLNGNPLPGKPFKLQPWQIFVVVNILGFFHKGTELRRFHEVLIFIPRKNGKTAFSSALGWALSILESSSGSKLYILANSLKQTMESFSFLKYNVDKFQDKSFKIRDNNAEHSISRKIGDGSMYIQALASDEKRLDSLNANLLILDELHTFKSSKKYILMKNAQKAYRNKLLIGISTAGDVPNGFLAQRLKYVKNILDKTIKSDDYFIFIAKADQDEKGNVPDFTDPKILQMANPSVGVSVSVDDLVSDAMLAQNDPQTRLEFFNKTLNIFTASSNSYFDLNEFRTSDNQYNWSLEDLAKMNITWYGGADLSKLHDLTASALYGRYGDVDIVITHAFFPRQNAHLKANEDEIPLFGWEEDGFLTMSDTPTVLYDDIVNWFIKMRKKGFKIKKVGFDKKFGREFFVKMKEHHFKMVDQPQLYYVKSEGFRRIEMKVKNSQFYYLHSEAYEYNVANVKAIEKVDDAIQYEKIDGDGGHHRIDLFDASVFGAVQMLRDIKSSNNVSSFYKK